MECMESIQRHGVFLEKRLYDYIQCLYIAVQMEHEVFGRIENTNFSLKKKYLVIIFECYLIIR